MPCARGACGNHESGRETTAALRKAQACRLCSALTLNLYDLTSMLLTKKLRSCP